MSTCRNPIHCFIPPYIIERLAGSPDAKIRRRAIEAMALAAEARAVRSTLSRIGRAAAIPSPEAKKHRLTYDMKHRTSPLPGSLVRSEGDPAVDDPAANEAHNNAGASYDFYKRVFARNSIDNNGMTIVSSIHFGSDYSNAFWNGEQMVYGDGDGRLFLRFTKSLDVAGHELTHGVIAYECNLIYQDEPGALNEHFADVMGSLISQWKKKQTAKKADWLIGDELMGPDIKAKSIRTFKAEPAYEDDPVLGTDPQPKHMKDKYTGRDDNGGVHINSGIPNHAFYLTAIELGGNAWEKAGWIWYDTIKALGSYSKFQDAAQTTYTMAGSRFGWGGAEQKAVKAAWKGVGITL